MTAPAGLARRAGAAGEGRGGRGGSLSPAGLALAGVAVTVAVCLVHLTQGTSGIGVGDLLALLTGRGSDQATAVLVASRLPRLLAGVLVGAALGIAGALLQSLARNPLASPDTLGVDDGAHLAVVMAAALGLALPPLFTGGLAFVGGLAAAGLVLAVSAAGRAGPTRLVLAGSAIGLALHALTILNLLLFQESTVGRFAWGSGTLVQSDLRATATMAPIVLLAVLAALALTRRLDLMALGDDSAAVLGVAVRPTRMLVVVLAVMLSAAAVSVTGPVGFIGLVAPVLVRLAAPTVPGVMRHRALLPLSALAGVLVIIAADVLLRAVLGPQRGVDIPAGVVTSLFGAVVLVAMARRFRESGPARPAPGAGGTAPQGRRRVVTVLVVALTVVLGAGLLGMLLGDMLVLTGDVANWAGGRSGRGVTLVLDARFPRVLGALLAGAALGLAGAVVQAVCRNPLAEPGLLGVTGGAGVGAVLVITLVPAAGVWTLAGVAAACALATFGLVYGLSWRGGLRSDRLVLIGIGVWFASSSIIVFLIVLTDPWNLALALTWLSGSTYGARCRRCCPCSSRWPCCCPRRWRCAATWTCWRSTTTCRAWWACAWSGCA